jgi:hypothetical protein
MLMRLFNTGSEPDMAHISITCVFDVGNSRTIVVGCHSRYKLTARIGDTIRRFATERREAVNCAWATDGAKPT